MKTKFTVGDRVKDSWWDSVCGKVVRVTASRVYIKAKYPSLVPYSFGMEDGIVRYDTAHAREYLIKLS
jgi:hypothetical protein